MSRPLLWHLELSHYSEKVRWALDHKRLPHTRRAPIPGVHAPLAMRLTGQPRMPILVLDGRAINDSTRIIAALEEHVPEPPLYPADPALRERALALEEFFDEHAAKPVRSFAFHYISRSPDAMVDAVMPHATGAKRAMMRAMYGAAGPYVRSDYRTSPDAGAVRAAMDRLESEIGPAGYLAGDAFTIADLAAAATFTPLVAPPQRPHPPRSIPPEVQALRDELTARPGGQWVFEMYARHRAA